MRIRLLDGPAGADLVVALPAGSLVVAPQGAADRGLVAELAAALDVIGGDPAGRVREATRAVRDVFPADGGAW